MLLGLPTDLLRPLILDSAHATYDGPLAWVLGVKLSNHLRAAVALIALSIVSQVLWIAWIWDAYSLSLSKIYWMP